MAKRNFFSHVRRTYYSYLWLDENGSPYYAGKGFGRRAYIRHNHKVAPPQDRSRVLIFPMESERHALESECALIALFGRRDEGGILHNVTNGGKGVRGLKRAA